MISRQFKILAWSASSATSVGVGVGMFVLQAGAPGEGRQEVPSMIYSANDGAMQSVRGIKGIDTVVLQNLEAVLRMQAPPPPPEAGGGGGGVRAAAALLTMENDEPPEPEEESDGREELKELELEGS